VLNPYGVNKIDRARSLLFVMSKSKKNPKALSIEHVPITAMHPAAYNPRKISPEALGKLKRAIQKFGLVDPIIARREDGLVIGGHQRLVAAGELGFKTVPVVYLDGVDDNRAKALNVSLNSSNLMGEFDFTKLADLLQEIDDGQFDVMLTGFDGKELERIAGWVPEADKEFDESVAGDVKKVECPQCGHIFPV
jgi:ParB-like chromosome segregation protein Spo0J